MAAKSSGDDPVDLGPFLQNYVMKNPFKAQQASTADGRGTGDRVGGRWTPRWRGSRPPLGAGLKSRQRGDGACTLNGVDHHTKVSAQCAADLLLHGDQTGYQGDVTTWLRDNYRYLPLPGQHRTVSQHLLLSIQQVFPDVSGDTIDDFVAAAFPGCVKFNNKKTGVAFYQGLVARPDPEVYENPLFIAALDSVTSGLLTTGQAAEKFAIRESALIAAASWSDEEQHSVAETTFSAATVSSQSDAVLSSAGRKRVYLTDSEQDSLDEPQCRRYRSSVDDAVDFEMMLQDVSSSGENPKAAAENSRILPQECVTVKDEPWCTSPDEHSVPADSQPLNFSLSVSAPRNTGAAAVRRTQGRTGDDRIGPSSPDLAATSVTSPVDCGDADSRRLRKELSAAVAENLALQEELSARDFHLAQLAEDFFCLHEQFKQLARHFQAVLGDIQPASDQSGVNHMVHNHTS